MPKTLFFDLDGTLTDSKLGIVRSIRYAFERLDMAAPDDEVLGSYIGPPFHDTFPELFGSKDNAKVALKYYRERFAEKGLFENSVYDGIPEVLTDLQNAGFQLYVATSKSLRYAEIIIDHFDLRQFFGRVFGDTHDGQRKTKDILLAYALSETGVDQKESVMIGDRRHDIAGARANGLASIGVLYGYGSSEELTEAGADKLVDAPQDLIAAVAHTS